MRQQFENPANIAFHVATTAQEIVRDFPAGLDALITGVGTGGHITGCAQVLKKAWPALNVFAVEPAAPHANKACWSASRVAPRSRRNCPNWPPARAPGFNDDTGERHLSVEGSLPA
jgi:cysteine synthase